MWVVMTSCARAPAARGRGGTRFGVYRNVAIVNISPEAPPKWHPPRIDSRLKWLLEVRHWGKYYVGKSDRSAYARKLREAEAYAEQLNAGVA